MENTKGHASIKIFKNPTTGQFATIYTFNQKILVVSNEITAEFKGIESRTIVYDVEYIGYNAPPEAYNLLNALGYTLDDWKGRGGAGITLE
ncbi:MAG TPA: hypothetical protein DEG71_09940 [Clostridiales bacterium]|nr:hypothetical protein [Clostridiales bacterium]